MLNYIWAVMLIIGILYGSITGNIGTVGEAMLSSAGDAVTLCITMLGVMSVWCGLMEVAKSSGLIDSVTKGIAPFVRFLFPNIPENHPAKEYITTNIVANVLGLGWAATPAGLKAMEALADLEKERGNEEYLESKERFSPNGLIKPKGRAASNEMCTFLILNISSLQLIPVNIIAYRSQYGSVNPAGIIAPAIVATSVSTLIAILFCKIADKK